MTEYLDYPHSFQIDASFGAEYDPYPTNRPRLQGPGLPSPGWQTTNNPQAGRPPSSAALLSANATSPIPTVHRLTRDVDAELTPTRTPGRSPMTLLSPMPGALPGASRFRELDQPEPTRWTSPTNVSFPASHRPSWMSQPSATRPQDGASVFAPMQASTPAPSRYGDPRSYVEQNAPRYAHNPYQPSRLYGAAADDDDDHSHPPSVAEEYDHHPAPEYEQHDHSAPGYEHHPSQEYSRHPSREYEYEQRPEDDAEDFEEETVPEAISYIEEEPSEEEFVPIDASPEFDEAQHGVQNMPGMYEASMAPSHGKQKNKRFVGGFMTGLKNLAGFRSKQPPPSIATTAPLHIPTQAPPYMPPPATNMPPRIQPPPMHTPPGSPPQHGDHSMSTEQTTSSHGPVTPDHSTELPGTIPDLPEDVTLPNPYQRTQHEIFTSPAIAQSPQQVELQHTADYDAMSEPIEDDQRETTFSSHINRVGKFITDLTHLPWISSPGHIAATYEPAESRRARYNPKPGVSWYTKENHQKLDLLATPTLTQPQPKPRSQPQHRPRANTTHNRAPTRPQPRRTRSPISGGSTASLNAATAIRPTHTPPGATSAGITPSSLGASSHGNGQQSLSYNYYYATPQPLYVYPSSVASPQMRGQNTSPDAPMAMPIPIPIQMAGAPGTNPQQAVPVYMLATPAPLMIPKSGGSHRHRRRSSRRPANEIVQMPVPQPAPAVTVSSPTRSPTRIPQRSPGPQRSPAGQKSPAPRSPGVKQSPTGKSSLEASTSARPP